MVTFAAAPPATTGVQRGRRSVAAVLGAGILLSGLAAVNAPEAQAADRKCVSTNNDGRQNGGKACWHYGDKRYSVEDTDGDYKSAWARVKYRKNGEWKYKPVITASGEGSMDQKYIKIRDGRTAYLTVCLQDNGKVKKNTCDRMKFKA
ncbi:hypothetical protein E0L36_07605 [Streptomyces sp. AJS327]|uniref:hypothetical protein n=1 Tax=Streptomyces sp. AJS327 TaxID=2545265 RepID=UPI0015DE21CB|nr:hypothetical protein [Streptomyces sp. AJS327]MBA0050766.1 hypothetical protein [Streptomyces sp. AJS327]